MGRAVAIGEHARIEGFALAGVALAPAADAAAALAAWEALPDDVALLLLTPAAAAAIGDRSRERPRLVCVEVPT